MSRLISEWPGYGFWDTQWSWMWVKVTLPSGIPTAKVIRVSAKSVEVPDGPYVREVNSNYPVDTSFVRMQMLDNQQRFEIHGVTFLFGNGNNPTEVEELRRNYIYRMWLQCKWFHHGPLLLFPGYVDMERFWADSGSGSGLMSSASVRPGPPWVDMWSLPLYVPPGMNLGIELEGVSFTPKEDMEFVVGMVGKMERPVQ